MKKGNDTTNIVAVNSELASLSYDELTEISRNDHQEDVRQYDKQQNALALTMIGAICFVCSILFFILSFERKKNKMAGIDFSSLQFFVFIGCLVAAVVLLTIGLIKFFKAHSKRKALKKEIMAVSVRRKELVSKEKEAL